MPDAVPTPETKPIVKILAVLPARYRWMMVLGSISALAQGVVFPAFSIVFGQLFNIFYSQTPDGIRSSAGVIAAIFVGLALYNLLFGYLSQMLWGLCGEEVGRLYRERFFLSVLKQEVAFFDDQTTGSLTTMLNTNVEHLRAGTGTSTIVNHSHLFAYCFFLQMWPCG
jgi:ATP-binding cassette subfamily B (MDR/TAP) protein 1